MEPVVLVLQGKAEDDRTDEEQDYLDWVQELNHLASMCLNIPRTPED